MSDSRKIRTRVERRSVKRIHNDLGNTAYHLQKRVLERDAIGDEGGILLDMMAALVMTAFWSESCFNFIGATGISGWNEGEGFYKKMRLVFAHCHIKADMGVRPYISIEKLKAFRNTLAHGKPEVLVHEAEEIRNFGDMLQPGYLESEWEQMRTVESVRDCYEDIHTVWRQMLKAIGMTELEANSHGSRGLTYLGEADE